MNEYSIEARQGYSSDLAGEWLSRLPIELVEEGELLSEIHSEPIKKRDSAPRIHLLLSSLNQLCSDVHDKCEDENFLDFYAQLRFLQKSLHLMKERSSLQRLSQTQVSMTLTILRECENKLTDMDELKNEMIFHHNSAELKSSFSIRNKAVQEKTDTIRSKLSSISSMLSVLNAS